MENCQGNVAFLEKAFNFQLQKAESKGDDTHVKYVEKWLAQVNDCTFQSGVFDSHLSHLTTYHGTPIPIEDALRYSVTFRDSLFSSTMHLLTTKTESSSGIVTYNIAEDPEAAEPVKQRTMREDLEFFKESYSSEQYARALQDVSNMQAKKSEFLEISADGLFLEYRFRELSVFRSSGTLSELRFRRME